ncbi:MAG: hypothetical protein AAB538_06275 [Patescibacteria group bacterium]
MAEKKQSNDFRDPTPATHGDLNIWGGKIQEDIQEIRGELAMKPNKEDLEKFAKKITDHFDKHIEAFVENRASQLLGVKHDEIREIQRKVKNHEQRITVLER